ncbi:AbrB/MazE/SpoVT family DNA-binding domain-containing protein [Caballeronia ptereochthonis]|uniref:AbrB/MazE/SpoVT family DNA-binding domain-containing protein n=1 Tax=Caballeronia ptereochthonis TaxID=1777144 RepID=UPI000B359D46|nr:AbrB/MazE/SpoVT family DNA-binding domain-containing protein [Caballeronia ptereochthonis]
MRLLISKWGNSLAVRIPADYLRHTGLSEGDQVQASLTVDGGICLRPAKWDRRAFAEQLARTRDAMPMTESVMDELRRGARY